MIRTPGFASFFLAVGILSLGCAQSTPEDTASDAEEIGQSQEACKDGDKKVEICHVPPGNPSNAHTIHVSKSALDAHLGHGDYLGKCDDGGGDDGGGDDGGGDDGGGDDGGGGQVCAADGALCSAAGDCCSDMCSGSGVCVSQCNPVTDGPASACSADYDCCAGAACIQGLCYEGFTCHAAATACNPDPESGDWCCYGLVCLENGNGGGSCLPWP